jgi:chemotaxis protein MotB
MARKKKHPEHVNHERWLVSYADFITLLFAFFTTMYAISTVDAQKMGKMVMSMKSSFDSGLFAASSDKMSLIEGTGGSAAAPTAQRLIENLRSHPAPANRTASAKQELASKGKGLGIIKRNVEALVGGEALKGRVRLRIEGRGLIISLGEGGFFDSGDEIIKPEGKVLLDAIATGLAKADNFIRVEGHTDDVPIKNLRFPSNWELSTARATAVIAYLITKFGLPPDRLSGAGYAEFHPVATNDTLEGKARNRRIDIVVLDPRFAEMEPQ